MNAVILGRWCFAVTDAASAGFCGAPGVGVIGRGCAFTVVVTVVGAAGPWSTGCPVAIGVSGNTGTVDCPGAIPVTGTWFLGGIGKVDIGCAAGLVVAISTADGQSINAGGG